MPKVIVSEFLTLDGVMQAPGDPNEDTSGGFARGGWQLAYFDDVFGKVMTDAFAETGGYLLGRRTYDIFAAHWPNQSTDDPLAATFNAAPKYVVSTTLREPLPWQNSHLISGDVPAALRKFKEGAGKDIQVIGSGGLVQTLMSEGIVDEYRLMLHPLLLGGGKRLFRDGGPAVKLKLVDSTVTTTGVVMLTYVPAPGV
ncbi:MAG: dihydrofolate reductase family protein [Chloroflexota bacterium]